MVPTSRWTVQWSWSDEDHRFPGPQPQTRALNEPALSSSWTCRGDGPACREPGHPPVFQRSSAPALRIPCRGSPPAPRDPIGTTPPSSQPESFADPGGSRDPWSPAPRLLTVSSPPKPAGLERAAGSWRQGAGDGRPGPWEPLPTFRASSGDSRPSDFTDLHPYTPGNADRRPSKSASARWPGDRGDDEAVTGRPVTRRAVHCLQIGSPSAAKPGTVPGDPSRSCRAGTRQQPLNHQGARPGRKRNGCCDALRRP